MAASERSPRIGIALTTSVSPVFTGPEQKDYVERLARATESFGLDSVWVSDRSVYPVDLGQRYPAQFGSGALNPAAQNVLEAVTTLSFLAGLVPRLRLGMSVLVLPFRHPVLNAKMLTTLDVLSGGRLTIGVGAGWMPEEFEAMGAVFRRRGAITDEHIRTFKALCAGESGYTARDWSFSGVSFFPPPVQKPHPPIWIGGNTDAALGRAAALGDGWHCIRLTPDEVAYGRKKLADLLARNRRAADSVELSVRHTLRLGEPEVDMDGVRVVFTGSPEQVASDLRRYRAAGAGHIVFSVAAPSTAATVEGIEQLAKEVLPLV